MNLVAHDIILRPVITEKSSRLMEHNQYTFEVHRGANKIQVRKAVEEIFKVKVVRVNTINVKSKPKRLGAYLGRSRSWKKAIVTLAPGERIEFFEGAGA
ncbi:ribosomal protein L23 [Thermanaerovibrio velox DSM 12556]|jgi:large subunit ribosomal protein L23|uniref:Large ribosomal subunit protein uL23 n=1 Tax=Thermanaerovibrio velox DSM 12556 TaxID=926567 RepID=H0UQI7_9BACT|nr:50S ribosomal protein L23 [Thermanaerovibrio velox]EHM09741.1 ribosomal protein L23 [Thermanaerovibrio velox DSM 12556]